MRARGYLDGAEMASTFRLLRSNSLIWHYLMHGWLYGEPLPPSDVLYWNMDTTRMPARMHENYLREMYLKNNLVKPNALTIAGEHIDLARIHVPLYQVTAEAVEPAQRSLVQEPASAGLRSPAACPCIGPVRAASSRWHERARRRSPARR